MNFRSVLLPPDVPGTLWLSSMPGRWEPWSEFMAEADRVDLAWTLCLTEPGEITRVSPDYRAALDMGGMPGGWCNVPVRDFSVPEDAADLRAAVEEAAARLRSGESVLLHCAAGIGRTGMTAACLLKQLGLSTSEALSRVRVAGSNPESAAQSGLIDWF